MTSKKLQSYKNTKGRNILHQAAYYGYFKIVADLLSFYEQDDTLNIYEQDEQGYTAFELVCVKGSKIEKDEMI